MDRADAIERVRRTAERRRGQANERLFAAAELRRRADINPLEELLSSGQRDLLTQLAEENEARAERLTLDAEALETVLCLIDANGGSTTNDSESSPPSSSSTPPDAQTDTSSP